MKHCNKCGKVVDTESRFCPACGSELSEVGVTFCPHCGKPLEAGNVFCPGCGIKVSAAGMGEVGGGTPSTVNQAVSAASVSAASDEAPQETGQADMKQEFNFAKEKSFMYVYTDIKADGSMLYITQYKRFADLIKYGSVDLHLDINDIDEIITKKAVSWINVLWLLVAVPCFFASEGIGSIVVGAAAIYILFNIKDSKTSIFFNLGEVKLPADGEYDDELQKFKKYVSRYNPGAVKFIME